MTNPGLMHLDAEKVDVGMVCRTGQQRLAVAEADIEDTARATAKQHVEVERRRGKRDPPARPEPFERVPLGRGDSAGSLDEAANSSVRWFLHAGILGVPRAMTRQ
jgi:hypothetical protein